MNLILSGHEDDNYYNSLINARGTYDQDLLTALKASVKNLKPGSHFLDVGANIGYISCILAKLDPDSHIFSFEPVKSNVDILKKNIINNKLNNIQVCDFGLGNKEEELSVSWDPDNRGSAFITSDKHERYPEHEMVTVKVLDNEYKKIGIQECSLVKVDIEGYELEFLRGAKRFLTEFQPTVIMEVNHWCLDALQNITMPRFLDELFAFFPYIHSFWEGDIIDINKHRELFMHENIVNNQHLNIICSFDAKLHNKILTTYQSLAKRINNENEPPEIIIKKLDQELKSSINSNRLLSEEIVRLRLDIEHLNNLNIKASTKELTKAIYRSIRFRTLKLIWGTTAGYQNSSRLERIVDTEIVTKSDATSALNIIIESDSLNTPLLFRSSPVRRFIYEIMRYIFILTRRLFKGKSNE